MNIYQTFITVVELGSFSAAASKLHRSPSSISKKIGLLESRLNVQLFDRTTRSLAVTEAGRLYYQSCKDIVRHIEKAESEISELSDEASGTINLTWPNAISTSPVVKVLGEFSRAYPNIKLKVNVSNHHENLIDANIDFAFRLQPVVDSSLIAIELFKISPVICASPTFIKEHGAINTLEELVEKPLVLLDNAQAIQKIRKTLPGLDPSKHHLVNDINALHNMALQGQGVTIIFKHMVENNLLDGRLINLMPELNFPGQPVYLMYHQLDYKTKKVSAFINFFKQRFL